MPRALPLLLEAFPMLSRVYGRLRRLVESLIAVLLFSFVQIPVVFTGTWPMLLPLGAYFGSMLWLDGEVLPAQIQMSFFEPRLMPGRIIATLGLALFLVALFQYLRQRGQIVNSGFYSVVRHPQYFSLIVMAYGISVMAREARLGQAGTRLPSFLESFTWLVLVGGYVLLSFFEEWCLTREHERYEQYRKEVPFLFPVPHKNVIQEAVFGIAVIFVMQLILMLQL